MRNARQRHRYLLLGLVVCAFAPLLAGFLCLPLVAPNPSGVVTPTPAALFAPTVSASVSNTAPGVASNVVAHASFPAGSTLPIGLAFDIPAGWSVASDGDISDGSSVGAVVGFMTVDDPAPIPPFTFFGCTTTVDFDPPLNDIELQEAATSTTNKVDGGDTDGDGLPEPVEDNFPAPLGNGRPDGVDRYPAFLNSVLPPVLSKWNATLKARYFGHTVVENVSDLYVNIIVTQLADGSHRVVAVTNDPTSPPESATNRFCAPLSLTLTLSGTTGGGTPVYRNPASSGAYTFRAALVSEFDHDNNGDSNGFDNCPATSNASQFDTDEDYVGDACDSAPAVPEFDVDGDGEENGYDNCMFAANADQADSDFDDLGNACDPNVSVPSGPNYYRVCSDPVGIGQADPGGTSCVAGTPPIPPTPTPTARPVGGVAELPDAAETSQDRPDSSSPTPLVVAIIASAAAGALMLAGATWYARKRRQ